MSVVEQVHPSFDPALAAVRVCRITDAGSAIQPDVLAVEEPLEVRLGCDVDGRRIHAAVSVTMRTPCAVGNVVRVDVRPGAAVDLARRERHFDTPSSCGVGGKASLEAV